MNLATSLASLSKILRTDLSYNEEGKDKFKRAGLRALRALAVEMNFTENHVSFNAGGIAVSGDLSMYGMFPDGTGVVLYLGQSITGQAGYCRSIKHLKDYKGGPNNWITLEELNDLTRLKSALLHASKQTPRF